MIAVDNLSITIGKFALKNVSFEIPTGGYGVLMGQTGSGKTTILESVCGLKHIVSGHVYLMNRDVTSLKPAHRGIGYVPQDGALFSTMTVRDHLSLALHIRKWDSQTIRNRVGELATLLEITHLLDRKPQGLSGGETQRVSLGRALSFHPKILCLDEPLSALDETTRKTMYRLLKSIRERYEVTTLHVTHSLLEAQTLADHVFTLKDGKIHTDTLSYREPLIEARYANANPVHPADR